MPEVILISAAFDGHVEDDMSGIRLSTELYSWVTEIVFQLAGRFCEGRLVSVSKAVLAQGLPGPVTDHVRLLLGLHQSNSL